METFLMMISICQCFNLHSITTVLFVKISLFLSIFSSLFQTYVFLESAKESSLYSKTYSFQVFPKTPRSKAAAQVTSTGHIDSPLTVVIGKKAKAKLVKTPKVLPKKGRKSVIKVTSIFKTFEKYYRRLNFHMRNF